MQYLINEIEPGSLDAPSEWNACIDAVLEVLNEIDDNDYAFYAHDFWRKADFAIESLRRKEQEKL